MSGATTDAAAAVVAGMAVARGAVYGGCHRILWRCRLPLLRGVAAAATLRVTVSPPLVRGRVRSWRVHGRGCRLFVGGGGGSGALPCSGQTSTPAHVVVLVSILPSASFDALGII